jgi:TRAP-type C4-dicarboxylate transport system substrate-binding protein
MKKFLLIPLVAVLVGSLMFGVSSISFAGPKVWKLKLAHEGPVVGTFHKYGKVPWVKDVEKATHGKVKITIYPSQTLCKAKDTLEAVRSGIADIGRVYMGYFPGVFPLSEHIYLPFLGITSAETAGRICWEVYEKFPEIQAEYKRQGVKPLAIPTTDINFIVTTKKPVRKLEDIKGLKLRVPSGPATDMMRHLGATPMLVPMPGCYINMQKGVMDGMGDLAYAVTTYKHYELVNYMTMVPLFCGSFLFVVNDNVWNSMPPDVQNQVMSVSGRSLSERMGREVFDRSAKEMPDKIKQAGYSPEYIYLSPQEQARWVEVAGKPVWDAWVAKIKAKGLPGQEVLDETLRLAKKYSK